VPPNPSGKPTKKGARLTPSRDENLQTTATEWQSTSKPAEAIVEGPQLKPIPSSEEPRRLQPVDEKPVGNVELPPVNTPAKHNPLRTAGQGRPAGRVVPTAGWAPEQHASVAKTATVAPRRNPLRSN
jgi:hypothetical protein